MGVVILEKKLKIVNIPKSEIHMCTHSLIKIVFYNENRNKFFSYTETDNEFTVVLDENNFTDLPTNHYTDTGHTWLALQASMLDDDSHIKSSGISKIAEVLINPLADFSISVYCISSYQTDFILVREQDLARVTECLQHSNCALYREVDGETVTVFQPPQTPPASPRTKTNTDTDDGVERQGSRPVKHRLYFPPERYYLASMTIEMLVRESALSLIQTLFYTNFDKCSCGGSRTSKFFSFSIVHKEISLILDEHTLHRFPSNALLYDLETFKMIKVGGHPLGFDECGIVAQISQPISEANIQEYYISTFLYDHTFVPDEQFDQVLQILKDKQQP